ncbi:probable 6-phosphogluconolactonase 1 isoform X3 [Coffea arabica]
MALCGAKKDGRELKIYENTDELSTDLADYIAELSENSVKERGVFAIALSVNYVRLLITRLLIGPSGIYFGLMNAWWQRVMLIAIISWQRMAFCPRVNMIYDFYPCYLDKRRWIYASGDGPKKKKVPVIPSHVHSINDTVSAEKAAEDYEFVIRQLVRTRVINVSDICDCPKFDLILLGMGPDGHVASLFPGHSVLDEKEQWVTFITDSPKPPPERITFTLPVINSASNVAVVVTGGSKADAVHLVVDDVEPDHPSLPAKLVQPTKGNLVWFLDKAAASKLDGTKFSE